MSSEEDDERKGLLDDANDSLIDEDLIVGIREAVGGGDEADEVPLDAADTPTASRPHKRRQTPKLNAKAVAKRLLRLSLAEVWRALCFERR